MIVKTWRSGNNNPTYGIRISKKDRDTNFSRDVETIGIVFSRTMIDDETKTVKKETEVLSFKLTGAFWKDCPEIRGQLFKTFFENEGILQWPEGEPFPLSLEPLNENKDIFSLRIIAGDKERILSTIKR